MSSKVVFQSPTQIRWCPGCGDYAILSALQSTLSHLELPHEKVVIVSGIGCSSRLPYYMDTFGFHTIHGRAPAVATGLKATQPDLSVWVVTGDGDGMSIGGNHLLHALRRNVDIKILFFNNEIYGLTKGQLSPTSKAGKVTPTTPYGSVENPVNPIAFALSAGASFVARTVDNDMAHMQSVFAAAGRHKGVAFVEILQNCVIFNDATHESYAGRSQRSQGILKMEADKPLRFGAQQEKGVFASGLTAVIDDVAPANESRLLIHDPSSIELSQVLAQFAFPEKPVPIGVFREVPQIDYHSAVSTKHQPEISLEALLHQGQTWDVE